MNKNKDAAFADCCALRKKLSRHSAMLHVSTCPKAIICQVPAVFLLNDPQKSNVMTL